MAVATFTFSGTSPNAPGSATLPLTGSVGTAYGAGVAALLDVFESMSVIATLRGATGGPLDVYLQTSPDGGTTWVDIAHYTQLAAGAAQTTTIWNTCRWNQNATPVATGDAAMAANTFVQGEWGDRLRVKLVAGALTTAGATQTITLVCNRVYPKL